MSPSTSSASNSTAASLTATALSSLSDWSTSEGSTKTVKRKSLKNSKKSRNGCTTCKVKRVKCDETKPSCLNCLKRNIECGGYATKFKWKLCNEVKSSVVNEDSLQLHFELAKDSITTNHRQNFNQNVGQDRHLVSVGKEHPNYQTKLDENTCSESENSLRLESRRVGGNECHPQTSFRRDSKDLEFLADTALGEHEKTKNPTHSPNLLSAISGTGIVGKEERAASIGRFDSMGNLERFEGIQAVQSIGSIESITSLEYLTPVAHDQNQPLLERWSPSLSAILNASNQDEIINHLEFDFMRDKGNETNSVGFLIGSPKFNLNESLVNSAEKEQILFLYSNHTSGIMSIKNGPFENPWRNVILPFARKYDCLYNSIAAMTLFHLSGSKDVGAGTPQELQHRAQNFMKKCILELAKGLSKTEHTSSSGCQLPADIALATCLNLAVSEGWDTHTTSGIAHLKGAKTMINKIMQILKLLANTGSCRHRRSVVEQNVKIIELDDNDGKEDQSVGSLVFVSPNEYERVMNENTLKVLFIPKSIQFLFNVWIYFEVLAQMTTVNNHDDKGIDLVATITAMLQVKNKTRQGSFTSEASDDTASLEDGSSQSSPDFFFPHFESSEFDSEMVDPLLGCGQGLFSIIGKVANLVSKIRKQKQKEKEQGHLKRRNSLSTITQATELRHLLLKWTSSITNQHIATGGNGDEGEDGDTMNSRTWDIASCIATAEAYRYSTLIFLHQAVPELPSLSSHDMAEKILVLLASIPASSNLRIVHILPLLIASCEAHAGEERDWCATRWKEMSRTLCIGNVDRAFEVVKEVWLRKDALLKKESIAKLHNLGIGSPLNFMQLSDFGGDCKIEVGYNKYNDAGIESSTHWTNVMKDWGWEVFLG